MRKLRNEELNRKTVNEFKKTKKAPVVIVLDNIRSLNNIGSVFRTADAFLIDSVYLCGITATPPHREIQKTALGATDSVDWKYFDDTEVAVNDLKENGFTIASVEQTEGALSLIDFQPGKEEKYAFVFGHEIHGVEQSVVNMSNLVLEIPQFGTKHSFNISVSAGIVLWDYFIKTGQKKTGNL
jgi:tRNA G18 (ribose-2'-O)-methylase SpoU